MSIKSRSVANDSIGSTRARRGVNNPTWTTHGISFTDGTAMVCYCFYAVFTTSFDDRCLPSRSGLCQAAMTKLLVPILEDTPTDSPCFVVSFLYIREPVNFLRYHRFTSNRSQSVFPITRGSQGMPTRNTGSERPSCHFPTVRDPHDRNHSMIPQYSVLSAAMRRTL
jgi:hypothetical protein